MSLNFCVYSRTKHICITLTSEWLQNYFFKSATYRHDQRARRNIFLLNHIKIIKEGKKEKKSKALVVSCHHHSSRFIYATQQLCERKKWICRGIKRQLKYKKREKCRRIEKLHLIFLLLLLFRCDSFDDDWQRRRHVDALQKPPEHFTLHVCVK